MYSPCNKTVRKLSIAALILGAVVTRHVEAATALHVCVDQANPTSGMDLRVARAAARTQGYSIRLVPFVGYGKGGDGLPPSLFAKMAQSECQLIMGFPVDVGHPNLPPNVDATSPYASTGFVLVRRRSSRDILLDDLPKGSEVGVAQLDTYAGLLFGNHPNLVMHVYPKDSLMVQALEAKQIVAGVAWQPSIEILANGPQASRHVRVFALPGDHMLWNLVALFGPQSHEAANLFNRGLYELQSKGQLQRLIEPYHQAAPVPADRAFAGWPAARLQHAVAWNTDPQQLIRVADSTGKAKSKRAKVPALYTTDQAAQGALEYYQNCAMCHAPLLDGQSAGYSGPALKGAEFADPSYDFHLSDIFNFVAKLMPAATPGSLSHKQDVEIMAFILQQNGYPAGSKELVYEEAEKSKVPIRYYGK